MAAGEYLKAASASLHQAANHLRQQAKELRDQLLRTQRDKQHLIDQHKNEIKLKQVQQSALGDAREQSRLAMEIEKLQQEIIAAEQQLREAEANLRRAAEAKLGTSTTLEGQARQLDQQSSAPELN
jgi:hypothetical protein